MPKNFNGRNSYRIGHIACSIGAGAVGMARSEARVGRSTAVFECAGGIDVDPKRIANFEAMTGSRGTVADLCSREQYVSYHGRQPPDDWREMVPDDLRRAFGGDVDVILSSPPCRGLSTLLDPTRAPDPRYQALNALTVRSVMLSLEAFRDSLKIFLLENVPGLAGPRGRELLRQITSVLEHAGFSVNVDVHDCGEIGGLAQHRKRCLIVARHMERVPPFVYRPRKQRMRTIGEVIGALPPVGHPSAGPMHRIPELKWKTWVRLGFVEPGRDWRSLEELAVVDGRLRDWGIAPLGGHASPLANPALPNGAHHGVLGIKRWTDVSGVVSCGGRPMNGAFAIADPSYGAQVRRSTFGVRSMDDPCGTITGNALPTNGAFSVADERPSETPLPTYAIVPIDGQPTVPSPASTGGRGGRGKYRVAGIDQQAGTVIASSTTGEGAYAFADPTPWQAAGAASIPEVEQNCAIRLISRDGSWHRAFSAMELAALQDLVPIVDGRAAPLPLIGSETAQRSYIGDAIPPASAKAMGDVILGALLAADLGHTFELSTEEIWAMPGAVALTMDNKAQGGAWHVEQAFGA